MRPSSSGQTPCENNPAMSPSLPAQQWSNSSSEHSGFSHPFQQETPVGPSPSQFGQPAPAHQGNWQYQYMGPSSTQAWQSAYSNRDGVHEGMFGQPEPRNLQFGSGPVYGSPDSRNGIVTSRGMLQSQEVHNSSPGYRHYTPPYHVEMNGRIDQPQALFSHSLEHRNREGSFVGMLQSQEVQNNSLEVGYRHYTPPYHIEMNGRIDQPQALYNHSFDHRNRESSYTEMEVKPFQERPTSEPLSSNKGNPSTKMPTLLNLSQPWHSRAQSNDSENDKSSSTESTKKHRTKFSIQQQCALEEEFLVSRYISKARRDQMAMQFGLHERQIKVWFQNRRMKAKKHAIDCRRPSYGDNNNNINAKRSSAVSSSHALTPDSAANSCSYPTSVLSGTPNHSSTHTEMSPSSLSSMPSSSLSSDPSPPINCNYLCSNPSSGVHLRRLWMDAGSSTSGHEANIQTVSNHMQHHMKTYQGRNLGLNCNNETNTAQLGHYSYPIPPHVSRNMANGMHSELYNTSSQYCHWNVPNTYASENVPRNAPQHGLSQTFQNMHFPNESAQSQSANDVPWQYQQSDSKSEDLPVASNQPSSSSYNHFHGYSSWQDQGTASQIQNPPCEEGKDISTADNVDSKIYHSECTKKERVSSP